MKAELNKEPVAIEILYKVGSADNVRLTAPGEYYNRSSERVYFPYIDFFYEPGADEEYMTTCGREPYDTQAEALEAGEKILQRLGGIKL